MRLRDFLRDHLLGMITVVLVILIQSLFLMTTGSTYGTVFVLAGLWISVMIGYVLCVFLVRQQKMKRLLALQEELAQKYLIAELMDKPTRADDQVYYSVLKKSHKSMLEEIGKVRHERREYREYIEQWIHEVKTPIAGLNLLCANHKSELTSSVLLEVNKVQHIAEQALFYARSECVEKDYHIKEHTLADMIHGAIMENKPVLLSNKVAIEVDNCELSVFTDEKWIIFILNQLISNAVKYQNGPLKLTFQGVHVGDQIQLKMRDNGIGIREDELVRVFEKGFTGSNGRRRSHATGIGLYLCKKLCDKLGVGIGISSCTQGTTIILSFYRNSYIHYD
ncbi:MAG: sensor histidine kinase [Cellulosilyticaceae bacterium]